MTHYSLHIKVLQVKLKTLHLQSHLIRSPSVGRLLQYNLSRDTFHK